MIHKILGIDPGTKCGWAVSSGNAVIDSGVWNLSPRRFEGGGMRYVHLRRYITDVIASHQITLIAFEEVRRHLGTDAAHIYGGIVATIQAICEEQAIPYTGIPVGTVKKFATGKGNASKRQMIDAAQQIGHEANDDNEADAIFVAICGSTAV